MTALLAFLVSVAYVPGLLSAPTQPKWWVLWMGTPAILLFLEPQQVKWSAAHWLGLAFPLWCGASLLWATSFEDGVGMMINLVALALVFVLGSHIKDLNSVCRALGIAASVNAVVMVWQALNHRDMAGLFLGHVIAAEFGVVALIGVLGYRLWWLVPGALVCALLPMSRGAITALIIALPLLFGPRQRFALWIGVLIGVIGALALDAALNGDRIISMSQRLDIWSWTWANITWFGYGLGNYANYFGWEFAHNEPLHFAFELGVGSLLLWAFFIAAIRGGDNVARATIVAVLVEASFSFTLHHAATAFMAALCAGYLVDSRYMVGVAQSRSRATDTGRHVSGEVDNAASHLRSAETGSQEISIRPQHPYLSGIVANPMEP